MRLGTALDKTFEQSVETCAAAAGGLAFLALLCWVCGDGSIAALGPNYVPMHALTASLMILLSCGVFLHRCRPSQPAARGFALCAVFGVEAMSLLVWAQFLWGFDLPLQRWLMPATAGGGGFPPGPMSPMSATAFVCAGLALLGELPPWGRRWCCRQTAALLALVTWSMSLLVLLMYASGTPLLYTGRAVPMSIVTAVSFSLLSFAILLAAGSDTFPLSLFQAAPELAARPSRGWVFGGPLFIFLVLSAGIGTVGYVYFRHQLAASRMAAQLTMSAIADLKVRQIVKWRQERLGNAQMIMRASQCRQDLQEFLSASAPGRRDPTCWNGSRRFENTTRRCGFCCWTDK